MSLEKETKNHAEEDVLVLDESKPLIQNSEFTKQIAYSLIFVSILGIVLYLCRDMTTPPLVCEKTSAVMEILAIEKKEAKVKLTNNEIVSINLHPTHYKTQTIFKTVAPGDVYCLTYAQQ